MDVEGSDMNIVLFLHFKRAIDTNKITTPCDGGIQSINDAILEWIYSKCLAKKSKEKLENNFHAFW